MHQAPSVSRHRLDEALHLLSCLRDAFGHLAGRLDAALDIVGNALRFILRLGFRA